MEVNTSYWTVNLRAQVLCVCVCVNLMICT